MKYIVAVGRTTFMEFYGAFPYWNWTDVFAIVWKWPVWNYWSVLLFSMKNKTSIGTWGWVPNDRIFLLVWTIPPKFALTCVICWEVKSQRSHFKKEAKLVGEMRKWLGTKWVCGLCDSQAENSSVLPFRPSAKVRSSETHKSITLYSPSILEPKTHSFSCFAPPNSCYCAVSWLNEQHAEDRTLWSPVHARQTGCDTHAVHAEEFFVECSA